MNNKFYKKVITGDGQNQKEQEVYFKDTEWGGNRAFIEDTEFDGHYTLWGFDYFPTTYLKSSGLSGDEWRKGGEIRYYKDRKQCYSEFCRDPLVAHNKIGATLLELMDFNWDKYKVGVKVWYRELPCVVRSLVEEQGCVILAREDGKDFPDAVWHDENDGCLGEGEQFVKVEVLDKNVYWYRK